ncbi:MAG: hypothetical protein V7638_3713 [Acidobacteriota bacterium]
MMRLIELVKEFLIGVREWLCFVPVLHGQMLFKEQGNALSKLCSNRPDFAALLINTEKTIRGIFKQEREKHC